MDEGYGTSSSVRDTNNAVSAGSITNATWKQENLCVTGKCLYFDGDGDYVSFSDDADLDFASSDSFTIAFWFRHAPISSGTQVMLAKLLGSDNDGGYSIQMESDGDITCEIEDDDADTTIDDDVTSTAATYDDNRWHYVTCVKSTTTSLTLYIDAVQVDQDASLDASSTLANDESFYLGIDGDGASNDYQGFLDEIKVYRSAKTAAEIKGDFIKNSTLGETSASFSPNQSYLSDSLVGYWPMDETTTNSCDATADNCDYSGNINHAAWVNSAGPNQGQFGNAVVTSASDYAAAADDDSLDLATSITITAWIYDTSGLSNQDCIVDKDSGSTSRNYALLINDQTVSDNLEFSFDGISTTHASNSRITKNAWNHIAVTYDSIQVRIFINGVLDYQASETTAMPTNTASLFIGTSGTTSPDFEGQIDELRIYNRALSVQEIQNLFSWAPGPYLNWKFDENTGTSSVYDSSSRNNTGTLAGSITQTDWVPGKFGSALDFDGTDDAAYIATASDADLDYSAYETFSGSAWVYISTMPGSSNQDAIITKWDETSTLRGYRLVIENDDADSTGNFQVEIYDESADQAIVATSANDTAVQNVWYHVAFTFNGNQTGTADSLKLYLNGVFIDGNDANASFLGLEDIAVDFSVGDYDSTDVVANNTPFTGIVDNITIFNYSRNSGQVLEDMNAGHPAPGSPMGSAVSHWKFDEGYDITANDSGTGENNLTLSTASWTNSGKFGKAWNGDGTIWLSKTNDADLDFAAAESFTLSGWFKSDSDTNPANGTEYLLSTSSGGTDVGYQVYTKTTGVICFGIDDDGTWTDVESCTTEDYYDGNWHSYVAVRNTTANTINLYIDGILKDSDTDSTTGTLDGNNTFFLGDFDGDNNGTSGIEEFAGDIDEVKVYRLAMTAEQVKTEYNQGSATIWGATSTNSSGAPSWSAVNKYCPPGQSTTCTAPVAHWPLDENSGTSSTIDISTNNFFATMNAQESEDWVAGIYNTGLDFDGSSEYLSITNSSTLQPSSALSISLWAKFDSFTDSWLVSNQRSTYSINYGYQFREDTPSNTAQFSVGHGANSSTIATGTTLSTNGWYHLVGIFDGSNMFIYLNGTLDGSTTASNPTIDYTSVASTMYLAQRSDSLGKFNGQFDDIRIYNYALTPAQIAWIYSKGKPVVWYRLDECTDTTANNAISSSFAGTINPNSAPNSSAGNCSSGTSSEMWNDGTNGKFNGSLGFDGTDDDISTSSISPIMLSSKTYTKASWGGWFY
jgi:hypothetical protein